MIGIYTITNKFNGKFYVGSSKNIQKRWYRHRSDLRSGSHSNIHLQRSWNKYGEDSFVFEVVETTTVEILKEKESFYILSLDAITNGFNLSENTDGGDFLSNHPRLDEIKEQISKSMKQNWNAKSNQELHEISKKFEGDKNPAFGKEWSSNRRQKYITSKTGKPMTEQAKENMKKSKKKKWDTMSEEQRKDFLAKWHGNENPFKGKKHTDETKEKLSRSAKERMSQMTEEDRIAFKKKVSQNSTVKRKVCIDGIVYDSMTEAAQKLGLHYQIIYNRIHSKSGKYDYKYYTAT